MFHVWENKQVEVNKVYLVHNCHGCFFKVKIPNLSILNHFCDAMPGCVLILDLFGFPLKGSCDEFLTAAGKEQRYKQQS